MKHYYFLGIIPPTEFRNQRCVLMVSDSREGLSIHEETYTPCGSRVRRIAADSAYCLMRQGTYPKSWAEMLPPEAFVKVKAPVPVADLLDWYACDVDELRATEEERAECDELVRTGVLPF